MIDRGEFWRSATVLNPPLRNALAILVGKSSSSTVNLKVSASSGVNSGPLSSGSGKQDQKPVETVYLKS